MLISLLCAGHLAGLILWLGGAAAAWKVHRTRLECWPEDYGELSRLERGFLHRAGLPGMVLTLATGAGMFAFNPAHYAGEGWLIAKLLLALGPVAGIILLIREERRLAAAAKELSSLPAEAAFYLLSVPAVLILLLTAVRPF